MRTSEVTHVRWWRHIVTPPAKVCNSVTVVLVNDEDEHVLEQLVPGYLVELLAANRRTDSSL